MFCLAASGALVFMLWLEHSFYGRRAAPIPAPVLLGVCLLMLNSRLARDAVVSAIPVGRLLLLAFPRGARSPRRFVALATSFHLTAIPFFVLYSLVKRGRIGWLAIVLLALLTRLYFFDLLVAFDVLPAAIAEKLAYYAQEGDAEDLLSLRTMVVLAMVSIVAIIACRGRPGARRGHGSRRPGTP